MKIRTVTRPLVALALTLSMCAAGLADTIRMKDGQVIRGQIVGFRDQQFTVLIGAGARGRRSRVTIYMEDVESIDFENAGTDTTSNGVDDGNATVESSRTQAPPQRQPDPRPSQPESRQPPTMNTGGNTSSSGRTGTNGSTGTQRPTPSTGGESTFFPVRVRVRADNSANGWTDSGLMVRKGQRLRVTASGRISLGQGNFSTPTGLPRLLDTEKLMRNEPTGTLIAVIGDDNDEFIAIGAGREFYAARDGRLFLGINEGKLDDNTGYFDALVEVEPVTSGGN